MNGLPFIFAQRKFQLCYKHFLFSLPIMLLPISAISATDFSGQVTLESRFFLDDPLYPRQDDDVFAHSLSLTTEYEKTLDNNQFISAEIFLRKDYADTQRTHGDIRELYWGYHDGGFEIFAGLKEVFWGVAESVHVTNIINQTDFVEDIEGEEKLGQPMLSMAYQFDTGRLALFVMPYFRERRFAGEAGRFSTPLTISDDEIFYESSREEKHIDLAIRWDMVIQDMDLGLSYFNGTSREPLLFPIQENNNFMLSPYYMVVEQLGVDAQLTTDNWLWKMEAAWAKGNLPSDVYATTHSSEKNLSAVAGFEYTFSQYSPQGTDLSVIVEYQYDNQDLYRNRISQNDFVLGARWALNDFHGSEFLGLISRDLDFGSWFINIEMQRRVADSWFVTARARAFSNTDPQDSLFSLKNDDYLQLEITRYF